MTRFYKDASVVTPPVEAAALRTALRTASGRRAGKVIADLTGITFLDSSALGVLLDCGTKLADDGGEFVIVAPDPQLRFQFHEARLDRLLRIDPTLSLAR